MDESIYEEDYIKESNEIYVAFTASGYIDNPTPQNYQAAINKLCCGSLGGVVMLQNFIQNKINGVVANYMMLRHANPSWNKGKALWHAARETIHLFLDVAGTVPVIGEVCDLTNGVIYLIEGDKLNATLSFAGAIPIAGWAATSAKFAAKVVNKTAADITSRQVLKWVKIEGKIFFGTDKHQARTQLRGGLMLTDGTKHAHHIIPVKFTGYAIVQKAAKSREAFHINEAINGIPLPDTAHLTGHNLYNDKIGEILINLNNSASTNEIAYQKLIAFSSYLRDLIRNNPNKNLGQIANLINY